MNASNKRDLNAMFPPFQILREKPVLFAILYAIPVLSVLAAFRTYPSWAYLFSLVVAFLILLFLVHSFQQGVIEDNHGRFYRHTQPYRFWFHILIWTFAFVFAGTLWPLGFARQEARKSKMPNQTVEPSRAPEHTRGSQ
jgi:hypothetical protein